MPAISLFDYAGITDTARPPNRTLKRYRDRLARLLSGKPVPRRRGAGRARLNVGQLTTLVDRIEAAIGSGVLDVMHDEQGADSVSITTAELVVLLKVLFPEEWPELLPPPEPTRTAPGSDSRLEVYAARSSRGQDLWHRLDACPVRGDVDGRLVAAGKLALAIVPRANGTAPKVIGWSE